MKKLVLLTAGLLASAALFAQQDEEKGYLTGSFESNSIYYTNDDVLGSSVNGDCIGSNSYLKADYYKGNFSAGLQLESYQPVLVGFPTNLTGSSLSNFYMNWADDNFTVTAGTFYDQLGSGLLFRSYQDRLLGNNSAMMGARFTYQLGNLLSAKVFWGSPRLGSEFVTTTQVRGADLSLSLANLIGLESTTLQLEGSLLNTYDDTVKRQMQEVYEDVAYTNGYSTRLNFERSGFVAKAEWVDNGDRLLGPTYEPKHGNAQIVELGYSGGGLGVNLTGRRLEWMMSPIEWTDNSTNNFMNYVPALCAQHSYLLCNLNPYLPQYGDNPYNHSGEIGGQLDVYYNFKRGSLLGGKRGMKVNLNISTYYTLAEEGTASLGNLLWRNINFGVEKQWNRKLKTNFLYCLQDYNETHGLKDEFWRANIFVADVLYKFTPKLSTRVELQYLTTFEDKGDWMAALAEVNFAPSWSIFVSDMYNHGNAEVEGEKVHYYSVGCSYTHSRTRVAFSWGRNRAGMVCSGGVCRMVPAYTGGNLTISTTF